MIIYWIIHFFAYYSMASAVIILLGKNVIKWSRFLMMRFRKLEIIYGITDDTVTFGTSLAGDRDSMVVFIGGATGGQENAII